MTRQAVYQDPDRSAAVAYGIDPAEWAAAVEDAYERGGADPTEAFLAGEDARQDLATPHVQFRLHRLNPSEGGNSNG